MVCDRFLSTFSVFMVFSASLCFVFIADELCHILCPLGVLIHWTSRCVRFIRAPLLDYAFLCVCVCGPVCVCVCVCVWVGAFVGVGGCVCVCV